METNSHPWLWGAFAVIVMFMLVIDLFVVGGGRQHRVSMREAAIWSLVWLSVSALFAGGIWWHLNQTSGAGVAEDAAINFITGYLIEKSLAIDNVFVWLMLFTFFAVPADLQKRVLVYGVMGAIVMRAGMIFAGAWLIEQFHWLLYAFGAFLLITGVKMWWFTEQKPDLEKNPIVLWIRSHMKVTETLQGERFFIQRREGGRLVRYATPLFLVLMLIEFTDLIFAVDSIPAIFAITTDPFIVLSSNVFAILGLRSMYFLLSGMADRFAYLKYGLAGVLMFVGTKMLLVDVYKIPVATSLGIVAVTILLSMLVSLRRRPVPARTPPALPSPAH